MAATLKPGGRAKEALPWRALPQWIQIGFLILLFCGVFEAWSRTASIETKSSGGLSPHSRKLSGSETTEVKMAIDYLDGAGYLKEANHLRRMLAKGEILVDPNLFGLAKDDKDAYGRTSNCYFWFQHHKILLSTVLFADNDRGYLTAMEFRIFLASVLLHEEVHTNQSDYVGSIDEKEQEAYKKQLRFLQDQVYAATPKLHNVLYIREDGVKLDLSSYVPGGDANAFCAKEGIK